MSAASEHFCDLRQQGIALPAAALRAGISLGYGEYLDGLRRRETVGGGDDGTTPKFARHDACVAALVAAGGYARLSERFTPGGHVVCLPLIPYRAEGAR